jgi:hypothetical protein
MGAKNPKVVTIYGRLSFPTFTAKEAYDRSQKGSYPAADIASAAPDFQLLVEQAQLDKLMNHVEQEFLPYCIQQGVAGEKRDVLDAKEVKALMDGLRGDLSDQTFNTPIKPVHEKTAPLAPEAVATVKVIGSKGQDFELKAIVNDEQELLIPDGDILQFPVIKPISQTVHSMYPGAYVAATLNLYAYHNGKHPGFSAGANVAVFKTDGERFGGGVTIDEDEIFAD